MTDLTQTIIAKSDQLNADDLIGGPITVTITRVSASGAADQPINVHYEGDDGKPYKPCKSMRRVMVALWGPNGANYVGRSMTLYRDDKVRFGGIEVGGIRISHMSHIDREHMVALLVTKGAKKPFKVLPLRDAPRQNGPAKTEDGVDLVEWAGALNRSLDNYDDVDELRKDWTRHKDALKAHSPGLFKDLNQAVAARAAKIGEAKGGKPAPTAAEEIPF